MPATARGPMKDFRFEGDSGSIKKIEAVANIDAHLVKYTNEEGKTQVRLAFLVPGTDTCFVGQHSISGNQVFVPATNWFTKQLKEKIEPNRDVVESV